MREQLSKEYEKSILEDISNNNYTINIGGNYIRSIFREDNLHWIYFNYEDELYSEKDLWDEIFNRSNEQNWLKKNKIEKISAVVSDRLSSIFNCELEKNKKKVSHM